MWRGSAYWFESRWFRTGWVRNDGFEHHRFELGHRLMDSRRSLISWFRNRLRGMGSNIGKVMGSNRTMPIPLNLNPSYLEHTTSDWLEIWNADSYDLSCRVLSIVACSGLGQNSSISIAK